MQEPSEEGEATVVDGPLTGGESPPPADADAEIFMRIGRFTVLRRLAEGAMGAVYVGYDEHLDRRVAIKVVRARGQRSADVYARMLREAQGLARLSHPNVVQVYEADEFEGRVYLAMEFIEGVTLRVWCRDPGRTRAELLQRCIEAGRGLAAAHRAGLVHRDFKPDNVMVGDDGRVRVMDLGLARASDQRELAEAEVTAEETAQISKLELRVTQAGAVLGTPAYMAPEQFSGADVDARADLWAFCVTLWEALYGQRPFTGDSMVRLAANVLAGKMEAPPRDAASRRVPRWLRRLCERGLAVDRRNRLESVPALLAAFERGRTRARAGRFAAGGAALAISVGAVAGWRHWDEAQRIAACEREGAEIDAVWNDDTRRALREGVLATGVSYAETTADKAIPYFDAQARRWRAVRTEVCLEARVHGTWTEDLRERASWCLEERRSELEALATELTQASTKTVQKAVMAAAALGEVEPCRDGPRLRLLPGPPEEGSGVAAAVQELSRAGALLAAGKHEPGLEVARAALTQAEVVQWPPLLAKARRITGRLLMEQGDFEGAEVMLAEAYFGAAQAREWGTAADAATNLVYTVGYRLARHAEGRAWGRHAEIALTVMGEAEEGLRRADLRNSLATLLEASGAYAESKALHERVLAVRERVLGPAHPVVATTLNNLANLDLAAGAYAEAKALLGRALALREASLGADHPYVASSLNNLAIAHVQLGEYAEARALYERARALQQEALGPDHPDVGATLNNLANLHLATGEYAEARSLYERARAIREKALGAEHPLVGESLNNLGEVGLPRKNGHRGYAARSPAVPA